MLQLWRGVMLVGYDERSVDASADRPARVFHSATFFDFESGEPVNVDMDEPANGAALAPGTVCDVEINATFRRRAMTTKDGRRTFVGRDVEPRFKLLSHKAVPVTKTAAAA